MPAYLQGLRAQFEMEIPENTHPFFYVKRLNPADPFAAGDMIKYRCGLGSSSISVMLGLVGYQHYAIVINRDWWIGKFLKTGGLESFCCSPKNGNTCNSIQLTKADG